jgi:hypothetical protein
VTAGGSDRLCERIAAAPARDEDKTRPLLMPGLDDFRELFWTMDVVEQLAACLRIAQSQLRREDLGR